MLIIYCDGGSRGNPGPAASAFVVTQDGNTIYKGSKFLGTETNNVAEYTAVSIAIDWLIDEKTKDEIIFNLDSQLVERQLNGFYKIKNEKLKVLADQIKDKIKTSNLNIKFQWGYRTNNTLADDLVNEELDRNSSR
ncbi:MAG: ribonuclease HI family protein [Microgenomates group bacterium]